MSGCLAALRCPWSAANDREEAPVLSRPTTPARRRLRFAAVLTALTALAAVFTAPSASSTPQAGHRTRVPRLAWADCGDGFECATARVPLGRTGESAELALTRIPARDRAHRVGTLFVNGGLHAGNGGDLLRYRLAAFTALADRFDVVGVDPRGQSHSTPSAHCMTFEEERGIEAPLAAYPTVADRPDKVTEADALTSACARNSSRALLEHMSTSDAADDLDLLRRAVGDDKLSYLGMSYGTVLGQMYAARYPGKVRAMVLDGAIHASGYVSRPLRFDREQLAASERSLSRFFGWCERTPSLCAFGGGHPAQAFDRLIDKLEDNRRAHPGRHDVLTGGLLLTQAIGGMIDPQGWPGFSQYLAHLDSQTLPTVEPPTGEDYLTAQQLAFSCLDREIPTDLRTHDRHFEAAARVSPHFGRVYGYGELKCARWPVRPTERFDGPWRYTGSGRVLVIGVDGDPLTPLTWAERVTHEMGRARLLSVDGNGHTAFGRGGTCVDAAITDYLTSGLLPRVGAHCALPDPA
ncbi:hydrolase [Wenjunlia tyrosinilytica]|uniref:Hydrolase n=1 Tax=Wenjunlia tyrosinilytica TaxID=1544741 RepID=A0A918E0D3_9ACTN|nr:hydrolase [Wenjunlia tyrosinilytica]